MRHGTYPSPCFLEGRWVDADGQVYKLHQQETFFSGRIMGKQMFATVQRSLSFSCTGPLGAGVPGRLELSKVVQYPPACSLMHFFLPNGRNLVSIVWHSNPIHHFANLNLSAVCSNLICGRRGATWTPPIQAAGLHGRRRHRRHIPRCWDSAHTRG